MGGATNVYFILVYQKSSISYRSGVGPWFSGVDWLRIVCLKVGQMGLCLTWGGPRLVRKCVCAGGVWLAEEEPTID